MASESLRMASLSWLKDFFPGYFALMMGTGIVAVAAHLLQYPILSWVLFVIALTAYPLLWAILLARIVCFPRAVIADFASHEPGPTFLAVVAATACWAPSSTFLTR
jgi:tellurite resistance protein TehA-like permease